MTVSAAQFNAALEALADNDAYLKSLLDARNVVINAYGAGTSGTWTKDADTELVYVCAVAGGGGGGPGGNDAGGGGGGGGSGGISERWLLGTNVPATLAYSVGSGGASKR